MTHTPGPWYTSGLSIVANYADEHGNRHHCHVGDATNRNEINRTGSMEEYANAQLIAAAPDLLEALTNLYDDTEEYIRINNLVGAENNHVMVQARAALAKARGEQ